MADPSSRLDRHSRLQRSGRRSARSSRALRAAGRWHEIIVVDDGSTRRHRRRAAEPPAPRRAASVQQGQRRRGEERHPPRDRRVHPDHRRRRPAPAGGCACGSCRGSASTTWSIGARVGRDAGDARRGASATRALNWLASYLTGPRHPGPDVRVPRRAARVPARVPAPAAERLLDADDDDAGVHQGGLQRGVRADRGARSASGQSKIRLARDGAKFLMIILQDHHALQPAADLPAAQPARRSRSAPAYAVWTIAHAAARHELVGAADHVRGRSSSSSAWSRSRSPRCASKAGSDTAARRVDRRGCVAASGWRCGSRSRSLYWVDKPLTHDEREYLALARSVARGDGFTLSRRRAGARHRRSSSAARPAIRCSSRRSASARRCDARAARASRSRRPSSARSASG